MARAGGSAETLGTKALRRLGLPFAVHTYDHREKGAAFAAAALAMPLERFAKTLVVELDGEPVFVLMAGDHELSLRSLARAAGARAATMAEPRVAERLTGYLTGGISPFGSRRQLPVYMDASLLEHEQIAVNGGRRGVIVELASADVRDALAATVAALAA